jgi:hypothetical protein
MHINFLRNKPRQQNTDKSMLKEKEFTLGVSRNVAPRVGDYYFSHDYSIESGVIMNSSKFHIVGILLASLLSAQAVSGSPFVLEANFQRIFDGTNFYGEGRHLPINLSVMAKS